MASTLRRYNILSRLVIALAAVAATAWPAAAFDTSFYAEHSALASGHWFKIAVSESGLYSIPNATLRSWGFSDPSRVRIHGYGGRRIDDVLSTSTYVDDLPLAPQMITDAGVVFYGVGPDTWERSSSTNYYHRETSPYTEYGYYFVTESDEEVPEMTKTGTAGVGNSTPVTTAQGRVQHEQELAQATEAGALFVGEDFRFTNSRTFTLDMPGRVGGTPVWMECQFVARHVGSTSQLTFTEDGNTIDAVSSDRIAATSDSHYVHASMATTRHTFTPSNSDATKITIGVAHSSSGVVESAHLDYITLNYTIDLSIPSTGALTFWSNSNALSLSGADDNLLLWDVTDPLNVKTVDRDIAGGKALWRPASAGFRAYVAWAPGLALPQPQAIGTVTNQDLHGEDAAVDMVIFTTTTLSRQANRIAALHTEKDGMAVSVVDVDKVYNEFSSGAADVSGLRKYLKMVYDRSASTEHPLRYALLLGRTTLDNRKIMSTTQALGYATMPAWVNRQARHSMTDNDGYSTDDFIAILGDGSGNDLGLNDLSIAVGRIPMTSDADGSEIVDKLAQYINSTRRTGWKNRLLVLADDEDQGVHLRQTEEFVNNVLNTSGQQHLVSKVYLDAYTKSNGEYPVARSEMFRALEDGVVWWFFAGHANNHSWTGDGQLTFTDINNMYLRNVPFVVACTCDFLRWDSETTSGGEIMYKERYGGAIGMVSATRPVYISDNGYFLAALGRNVIARDADGAMFTAGEVYRRSKNNILNSRGEHVSNSNRLRFVFMGDPAMRLATPDNMVQVLTINGKDVDGDEQIVIPAMSSAVVTGRVVDAEGNLLEGFNGSVTVDLFDALTSVTTNGNGNGSIDVFDKQGDKLFAGSATVKNGEFTLTIAMPSMVSDNFRPAAMSLYAAADDSNAEAIGACRDFYVYGFEDPETPDEEAPSIEFMYLNHDGFADGDRVNSSPMLIARVSDNVGINLSTAGVGQKLSLTLDGSTSYNDLSSYYTPSADGTASGVVNYSLESLQEGEHTLRLRVYDTSGNMAEREIKFTVDDALAPSIFEVYTDACPAHDKASFYVKHDRPESIVEVGVTVYDLLGRQVWTGASKGMSDMNVSSPVTWDLTDMAGRRVQRGIYIYRASITTDNAHYESATQRIAVAAQ